MNCPATARGGRRRPKRSPTKHRHLFWQTPEIYECILFAHIFLVDPLPFGSPSSRSLLLVLVRFQFLPSAFSPSFFFSFRPSSILQLTTLRVHTLIFFLAIARHKSSSRSTPKIRRSRLNFQRAYECTKILLIEVVLVSEEKGRSCHHRFINNFRYLNLIVFTFVAYVVFILSRQDWCKKKILPLQFSSLMQKYQILINICWNSSK